MTTKKFETLDGFNSVGAATLESTLTVAANTIVGTNVLYVDTVNGLVGIGKVPSVNYELDIDGDLRANTFYGDGSNLTNVQIDVQQVLDANVFLRADTTNDFNSSGAVSPQTLGIANNSILRVKSGSIFINTNESLNFGTSAESTFSSNGTHLNVTGTEVNFSNTVNALDFNTPSDLRLKTNVHVIEDALDKIKSIRGVTFEWKESKKQSAGVIAQEISEVLPQVVKESGEHYTVNYDGIIALLIEAIKELEGKVNGN